MTAKPIIRYKLTDSYGYTRRGNSGKTLWEKGTVRETSGLGNLCGPGWTHVYTHPLLAVLLDPIHGDYGDDARLIEVAVSGKSKSYHGLKEGWPRVAFHKRINKPKITRVQKIAFGILCAKEVYSEKSWISWANDWLSGKNRSNAAAAYAAAYAANGAAHAAAYAAAYAAHAAYAAAYAAKTLDLIKIARAAMRVK